MELEKLTGSFLGCGWEQTAVFSFSVLIKPTPGVMCYPAVGGTPAWVCNVKLTALQGTGRLCLKLPALGFCE